MEFREYEIRDHEAGTFRPKLSQGAGGWLVVLVSAMERG